MSYFKQVLCYACREAVSIMNALAVPTDSEATAFNLAGWNTTDFLETQENFSAWQNYANHKLFGGQAPAVTTGVSLGKNLECASQPDYNGTQVRVPAGTCHGAKSLSAYLWLAATEEGLNATSLCRNVFECG